VTPVTDHTVQGSVRRVADAVRVAAEGIEAAVIAREGSYAREEEL
jgi:TolB-like protein